MVVNAPESPIQANVIFVIETTSANSVYINELKTNYIVPTLEYFHGGALEEGIGSGSIYGIVAYQAADCHPDLPVSTYGPFTCPQAVLQTVDELQFIGGHAENRACITEALSAALECLEELGGTGLPLHVILLCCSPPYSTYTGGLVPPGAPNCVEQAARLCAERGAQLSVAAARRVPALLALYEHAGGELHAAQQRNYAKDPRHLVLLRGYSLKERPPSPAPPPAPLPPLVQTEVFVPNRTVVPQQKVPQVQFQRGTLGPVKSNFLAPPRQAPYANSALLTQLSQPSYPPPPTQSSIQRMVQPGPSNAVGVSSSQGVSVGNIGMNMQSTQGVNTVGGVGVGVSSQGVTSVGGVSAPLQRTYIWSGVLEWLEKSKASGDQKVIRQIPCQVSANSKEVEPELKADTWPNKLLMQLMHKQLITNIGGQYLNNSKSVLFHFQQNEALEALTKVMVGGFAGCVHFSPHQCDIRVLILLYTPDKKAYLGFIPNNQATFVDRLRKVIQQQKISKQLLTPGAPQQQNMPGAALGTGMQAGLSMGGTLTNVSPMPNQQPQQHQQNMMMGGGMGGQVNQVGQVGQVGQVAQVGQVGAANKPRGVPLDGLEAARQQNLEKIQHLQQTLEAAHQQEAQFKSQMDIMSHLHAAQQQEQHYKQLEEQRKHQLLQQQLRAAPRIMRPHMPANPGLRHLLQQQPQYRASTSARPQQFDDVSNYDFL